MSADELCSVSDDQKLTTWSISSKTQTSAIDLPANVFPNCLEQTRSSQNRSKSGQRTSSSSIQGDDLIIGATDVVGGSGGVRRLERGIEAHKGAILCLKWNTSGTNMATASPVYSLAWRYEAAQQLLYSSLDKLCIQSVEKNHKPRSWKAHEGIILCCDWNNITDLIISGGEDCIYRIWDVYGRNVSTCPSPYLHPVNSVAWAPDGLLGAVGSFNLLTIVDRTGSNQLVNSKLDTGSLQALRWSSGHQLAGACGNGRLLVLQATNQRLAWAELEARIVDEKVVEVIDFALNKSTGSVDRLECRDRIVCLAIGFHHLLVATAAYQCYVYSTKNLHTPVIVNLKNFNIHAMRQCARYFVLSDGSQLQLYAYDGRLICSQLPDQVKIGASQDACLTLSNDSLAALDRQDAKVIHLLDIVNGKFVANVKPITHTNLIRSIELNQCGSSNDRRLAYLDFNNDLYLASWREAGKPRKCIKLDGPVSSFAWSETANILGQVNDRQLSVWLCPTMAFGSPELAMQAREAYELSDSLGKSPTLVGLSYNRAVLRQFNTDQCIRSISSWADRVHQLALTGGGNWNKAILLCRTAKERMSGPLSKINKEESLWACLASLATCTKELDIAEIAFAELESLPRVQHIRYIRAITDKILRTAEIYAFCGDLQEAEQTLLQAGRCFHAILFNLDLFRWDRALYLARTHKLGLDVVLSTRKAFLTDLGKPEETWEVFSSLSEHATLEGQALESRIARECAKELDVTITPKDDGNCGGDGPVDKNGDSSTVTLKSD